MATYDVLSKQGSYLTVRVLFADQAFEQLLVTSKTGTALDASLKSYADAYETDWFLLKGVVNGTID
jgi:hypothetical protein